MNIYFLLEDSISFYKVLSYWMNYILPNFFEVDNFAQLSKSGNHFFKQSGHGYPQVKDVVFEQTVQTILEQKISLDYFVVILDGDARNVQSIESDIGFFKSIFDKHQVKFNYRIFIIDRCFETWLLGNCAKYVSASISEKFKPYSNFYDVSLYAPEKMNAPPNYSIPKYHCSYLQEMLRNAKDKKNYSKGSPLAVSTREYFDELYYRARNTTDLKSFRAFLDFLESFVH